MSDPALWSVLALAGTTAMHSIPHIVQVWRNRSEAETKLVLKALADVQELRSELKAAEGRIEQLEGALKDERVARSNSDGQVAILQQQLDRTEAFQELWEKRARKMKSEFDDLYDALHSSAHGKSLPPRPVDDW